MTSARATTACVLCAMIGLASPATGAEDGRLSLELNDLQPAESGCRAVFVLHNGLDKPLEALALRVVSFDRAGHARLFLSLEVGALPVGKTRILRFDLGTDVACEDIGHIVLDDVTGCEGPDIGPPQCLAATSLSSRAKVPFNL